MVWSWQLFFEGVRAFLEPIAEASLPIAIVVVVLIFRTNISEAIGRIRTVRGFGSEADFDASLPQKQMTERRLGEPDSSAPSLQSPPQFLQLPVKPPANDVYEPLESLLAKGLAEAFPDNQQAQLEWALRRYAVAEVERFHESNYRIMFGSQLSALNFLNQVVTTPIPELDEFYKAFRSTDLYGNLRQRIDFSQWLSFITLNGYAEISGNQVAITALGKDFLTWLVGRGVDQARPG